MTKSALVLAGGILGALAIAARAFEAHGLAALAEPSQPRLDDFRAGTEMLMLHAPAVLALAGLADYVPRVARYAGVLFTVGVISFAGPLLHYGASGMRSLMILTPIGGSLLILGWILIAIGGALKLAQARML